MAQNVPDCLRAFNILHSRDKPERCLEILVRVLTQQFTDYVTMQVFLCKMVIMYTYVLFVHLIDIECMPFEVWAPFKMLEMLL